MNLQCRLGENWSRLPAIVPIAPCSVRCRPTGSLARVELPWTIQAVSRGHYENFPVASLLCPPALRAPIVAIYRFARTADDIADEGDAPPSHRLATLADYASTLTRSSCGLLPTQWPEVFLPLRDASAQYSLPIEPMQDLLDAFAQDCSNPLYVDRSQLLDYCRRSANPIGRLLLHLYEVSEPLALKQSDAICTALQLINFWQDASIDLPRGRNYFPLQDLQRHGLSHGDLQFGGDCIASQAVLAELAAWTQDMMMQGCALVNRLPGRIGWELALVVQGGLRILAKIAAMEYRTLGARPQLSKLDYPAMAWRAARMRWTKPPQTEAAT